jgi:hypothetical protein
MRRLIRWLLVLLVVTGVAFIILQKNRPKTNEVVINPVVSG